MNDADRIDILMVTYDRLEYTRRALPRLLDSCDEAMRVWVRHNGNDEPTLEFVRSVAAGHPRFHQLHHSPENKRLREPTNWFWATSTAPLLAKVDDDNLMPDGWGERLRALHAAGPKLGVIGCWSFLEQDVVPELAERKVRCFGGHRMMANCWVSGTGHVMKRACYESAGPIPEGRSFTQYCIQLAAAGWVNGYAYPFVLMENLDDPRHPLTQLKTEADFQRHRGLSARRVGVQTLAQLRDRQSMLALDLQTSNPDPRAHLGWRRRLRQVGRRLHLVR
jgi:hypothetical protein